MSRARFIIRRILGWILTLGIVYVVFIMTLGFMQKRLIYFPDPVKFVPSEWALKELRPLDVTTEDQLHVLSWYSSPKKPDKFTIVFFQGNAGHLGYRNYKVRPWIDNGYGVLMVGYRGFGNPGAPSERGFYADARASIRALEMTGIKDKEMVFYGESMGTGVATQMATEFDVAGLILESPYTSVPDVAADRYPFVPVYMLISDKFNSLEKIGQVHTPVLIMHGDIDQVIPQKFGRQLYDAANEPKTFISVPGAGHNDVYNAEIQQRVLAFLAGLSANKSLQND